MTLIRYHVPEFRHCLPLERQASLHEGVNRLFNRSRPTRDDGLFTGWSPALDLDDAKDRFVVTVELPGLKKEDIQLSIHEGVLSVSGERKLERENKEGETFRSERYFGKFQRSVTLPAAIDPAKVAATYKDGILSIELAKVEAAKPQKIEVSVS